MYKLELNILSQCALQNFPNLCTWNLHVLLCRIIDQARSCGWNVAADNELWVERKISALKKRTRYHVASQPASYVANLVKYSNLYELISRTKHDSRTNHEPDQVNLEIAIARKQDHWRKRKAEILTLEDWIMKQSRSDLSQGKIARYRFYTLRYIARYN